jgi:hypothetical protein
MTLPWCWREDDSLDVGESVPLVRELQIAERPRSFTQFTYSEAAAERLAMTHSSRPGNAPKPPPPKLRAPEEPSGTPSAEQAFAIRDELENRSASRSERTSAKDENEALAVKNYRRSHCVLGRSGRETKSAKSRRWQSQALRDKHANAPRLVQSHRGK